MYFGVNICKVDNDVFRKHFVKFREVRGEPLVHAPTDGRIEIIEKKSFFFLEKKC